MAGILRDSLSIYTDGELISELDRRTTLRSKNLCASCKRLFTETLGNPPILPCLMHERAVERVPMTFLLPTHPP